MTTQTQQQVSSPPEANGNEPPGKSLADAIAYEGAIANQAKAIRLEELGEAETFPATLSPHLFQRLYPLLLQPIPLGYIEHVGETTGKPYESTGVRSVQVQINRLNNVLTPLWWHYTDEYEQDGKLCKVTVTVEVEGNPRSFSSYGGMNRGSTVGNLYKGSFTNAAKLAIARLGPGWEVYVGAADFDPDTDEDAAKAQESESSPQLPADEKLPDEFVAMLGEKVDKAGLSQHLPVKLRSFGVDAMKDLTVEQGRVLWAWSENPDG